MPDQDSPLPAASGIKHPRIGHGYDVHRLTAGRRMVLGGVHIPSDFGPEGHSDADVLLHALADALLGALALGDIGKHFPDTSDNFKDADSQMLLRHVVDLIHKRGYRVGNADCTLILEAPKIAPFVAAMQQSIADCLQVTIADVSVKATTSERLGFVGAGLGVQAHAVALLVPKE